MSKPEGGGSTPLTSSSEGSPLPTGTNYSQNGDRGWGVKSLGKYEMEKEGFFIVKKVVFSFLTAWGNRLDAPEIESAAMSWLATHQTHLMASHSSSAFTALAYKSLFRKLSPLGQEMKLEQIMVMSIGGYGVEETETLKGETVWIGYTTEEVLIGLENSREEFFILAENSCTKLQANSILKRFKEKKEIKQIADEDGRTPSAVHHLINQGIKNIASKGVRV